MLYIMTMIPITSRYVGWSETAERYLRSKKARHKKTPGGKPAPRNTVRIASVRLNPARLLNQRTVTKIAMETAVASLTKSSNSIAPEISAGYSLCQPVPAFSSAAFPSRNSGPSLCDANRPKLPSTIAPTIGTANGTVANNELATIDATFAPAAAPPSVKNTS